MRHNNFSTSRFDLGVVIFGPVVAQAPVLSGVVRIAYDSALCLVISKFRLLSGFPLAWMKDELQSRSYLGWAFLQKMRGSRYERCDRGDLLIAGPPTQPNRVWLQKEHVISLRSGFSGCIAGLVYSEVNLHDTILT